MAPAPCRQHACRPQCSLPSSSMLEAQPETSNNSSDIVLAVSGHHGPVKHSVKHAGRPAAAPTVIPWQHVPAAQHPPLGRADTPKHKKLAARCISCYSGVGAGREPHHHPKLWAPANTGSNQHPGARAAAISTCRCLSWAAWPWCFTQALLAVRSTSM
jgi:hypothetical protein